jgi:pyroglutamyl-peptidase
LRYFDEDIVATKLRSEHPVVKINMPIALVFGFEPFDGERINPSQEIARALHGEIIMAYSILGASLPTEFGRSLIVLDTLIEQHKPSLVIGLGQAGGRSEISLERVAINLIDARIADNAGDQPIDVAIVEGGPNAYFSTLPIKAMLARLKDAGIQAAISHTAGTFVCNQVFFALAHRLCTRGAQARGGFIHVPYLPEQAARHNNAASMSLATMIEATRLCLQTALNTDEDAHFAAGSEH